MINFDEHIYNFLRQEKSVCLEKIGKLELSDNSESVEFASRFGLLHFEYNKNSETSDALSAFIAEKVSKSKTLIDSDLSSYLEQARQFLNIGKAYEIENIGIFRKTTSGVYEFSIIEPAIAKENNRKEKKQEREKKQKKSVTQKDSKNLIMLLALAIVILIVGGLGWGAYKMFFQEKTESKNEQEISNSQGVKPDSATLNSNPQAAELPLISGSDSLFVKFIFETTNSELRATSRVAKLRSFGNYAEYDSIPVGNGMEYQLYLKEKILPVDTTRVKDSLQKYFQRSISIKAMTNIKN